MGDIGYLFRDEIELGKVVRNMAEPVDKSRNQHQESLKHAESPGYWRCLSEKSAENSRSGNEQPCTHSRSFTAVFSHVLAVVSWRLIPVRIV